MPDQMTIADAYETMCNHTVDFTESIDLLLHQIKCVPESDKEVFDVMNEKEYISCAEPAIVCDKPQYLDKGLRCTAKDLKAYHKKVLAETCCVLERNECKKILEKHSISTDSTQIKGSDKAAWLLHILQYYPKARNEVVAALKQQLSPVENLKNEAENSEVSDLHLERYILGYIYSKKDIDLDVVKHLFELGAQVDSVDEIDDFEGTLLEQLLVNGKENKNVRGLLEMLLYENPSPGINSTVVGCALTMDNEVFEHWRPHANHAGDYILDGKQHERTVYDDVISAFTFAAPLLVEAGFPFSRTRLEIRLERITEQQSRGKGKGRGRGGGLLDTRVLHPSEKLFFEKCLDEPRSLLLQCRDCLRRQFKGRKLHTFIKASGIPTLHQDFILLKSLLHTFKE